MHFKKVKGILSSKNGMNLCRGCIHGCIYCDSRSLCYNMDHDFEDVEIKINAAELLELKLRSKRKPCMIGTGAMSDPYIPIEESLNLTRTCLQLIERYNFGLSIITKSNLILRDLDLLASINRKAKCVVQMTLTTFDEELCKILEPNVCTSRKRFEALKVMHDNGIKTVVWLCPILPFINDTEENLRGILDYCIEAKVYGILCFGMGMTLREGDREYYYEKLDKHFPGLKDKYISNYGNSYSIASSNSKRLFALLKKTCAENKIICDTDKLFEFVFTLDKKEDAVQQELWNL